MLSSPPYFEMMARDARTSETRYREIIQKKHSLGTIPNNNMDNESKLSNKLNKIKNQKSILQNIIDTELDKDPVIKKKVSQTVFSKYKNHTDNLYNSTQLHPSPGKGTYDNNSPLALSYDMSSTLQNLQNYGGNPLTIQPKPITKLNTN